jgi:hypothetical protein
MHRPILPATLLLLIFSLSGKSLSAQGLSHAPGNAKSTALGNVSTCFSGIYATTGNAAGLGGAESWEAGVFAERRYLLAEVQSFAATGVVPAGAGAFAIGVDYFGFEQYNEKRLSLAYGRKLLERLMLGARVYFTQYDLQEYGNRGVLGFDLGLQAKIREQLTLGFTASNPLPQEIVDGERQPTVLRLGAQYQPLSQVAIYAELEQDIDAELQVRGGVDYRVLDRFSLRGGFATGPAVLSFGLGYTFPFGLTLDAASSFHQYLGVSPSVGLIFSRKR